MKCYLFPSFPQEFKEAEKGSCFLLFPDKEAAKIQNKTKTIFFFSQNFF
jgi:hypothetical protein